MCLCQPGPSRCSEGLAPGLQIAFRWGETYAWFRDWQASLRGVYLSLISHPAAAKSLQEGHKFCQGYQANMGFHEWQDSANDTSQARLASRAFSGWRLLENAVEKCILQD